MFGPLRSIRTKARWRELLSATAHFGFWINPSLLRPSWPSQRKPALKWGPILTSMLFLANQNRIVTKNRSISKAKINNCQLLRSLPKLYCLNCPQWTNIAASNTPLYVHTSSQIFNPVGSLTRQGTGPGWQLSSPTECLTIVKARALCHPLAKPDAGLSRQL